VIKLKDEVLIAGTIIIIVILVTGLMCITTGVAYTMFGQQQYTENIVIKDVYYTDDGVVILSTNDIEYSAPIISVYNFAQSHIGKEVTLTYVDYNDECLVVDIKLYSQAKKRCNVKDCGTPIKAGAV